MRRTIQKSIRALVIFSLICGVFYPLMVTVLAQLIAPRAANGSLVTVNDKAVGSSLLGQKFTKAEYFWGRPSAVDYGTMPGGASNLGPTSQKLNERVTISMKDLGVDPNAENKPYELLLASGSGLDPDITPEGASFQADRVARARGLDASLIRKLIDENTEGSFMGLIGRPRVNVLRLNLALDGLKR